MEYISSDTNVWIDFYSIGKVHLPFKLPYTYIMFEETVKNELIRPAKLSGELIENGLVSVDITTEELILADQLNSKYKHPSNHDCFALAIAKNRHIVLLTGDKHLRAAAELEGVAVIGTIGILDKLYKERLIQQVEYIECLKELDRLNGGVVRLPKNAIRERLSKLK